MWMPDPQLCPPIVRESLDRYAREGIPTGEFLRAVLENDLKEAIGRADWINGPSIHHIVSYCYNHLPSTSWGSLERVDSWLEMHRKRREEAGKR